MPFDPGLSYVAAAVYLEDIARCISSMDAGLKANGIEIYADRFDLDGVESASLTSVAANLRYVWQVLLETDMGGVAQRIVHESIESNPGMWN